MAEWNRSKSELATTPSVTVVCPPREIFAPLRMDMEMSWQRIGDVPSNYRRSVACVGDYTDLLLEDGEALLWLKVLGPMGRIRAEWVRFNYVGKVGLEN